MRAAVKSSGARARVNQQIEQRWQKQVEKARKQLEREQYVAEYDKECEEVLHLMNLRGCTTEESQRLHQLRPSSGMFAEQENCQLRRRNKQAERYRKQDQHAVMTPTMRSAAEEKQAQLAQELEIDSSGSSTSSEGERQQSKREKTMVTDWRGDFVAAISAGGTQVVETAAQSHQKPTTATATMTAQEAATLATMAAQRPVAAVAMAAQATTTVQEAIITQEVITAAAQTTAAHTIAVGRQILDYKEGQGQDTAIQLA